MKLFRFLSVLLISIALFGSLARGQTNQTLNLNNYNNKLFQYGYQGFVSTTNNTATTIATFLVGSNEAGMLTADVVGFDSTNGDYVQGVVLIGYKKTAGTLTLGTADTLHAISGTGGLSGGAIAFSASSNNILLKVTGATSKTVKWIANIRWIKKKT